MEIYIDKRSQKYQELDLNNNVEICWFFSKSNCQFRFRGTSEIVSSRDNLIHWDQLSEFSKSMWNWPSPGELFAIDKNKKSSFKTQEKLSINFAVLKIDINQVDQLLLHQPIHTRRRWTREKEWIEARINP